jgi:hypothetical protein
MDAQTKQAVIIDFINRSFRDVADADYVCARFCHRLDLKQQFLWAALQAIEKYLKGILLYNRRSTKGLWHNIQSASDRLQTIKDIPFDIPNDVEGFFRYLNLEGANRYFEYPYATVGDELLLLDKSVWYVRRYCQPFSREVSSINGKQVDWFKMQLKDVHDPRYKKRPNTFKISGGLLEKITRDKESKLRLELNYKNFWYGTYTKHKVRNLTFRSGSSYPAHFLHPEIFDELDKLVQFSPSIRQYFLSKKQSRP